MLKEGSCSRPSRFALAFILIKKAFTFFCVAKRSTHLQSKFYISDSRTYASTARMLDMTFTQFDHPPFLFFSPYFLNKLLCFYCMMQCFLITNHDRAFFVSKGILFPLVMRDLWSMICRVAISMSNVLCTYLILTSPSHTGRWTHLDY